MGILRMAVVAGHLALSCSALATTTVVEYYNTPLGHYFITALPGEIAALDSGAFAGWARTGYAFDAWSEADAPAQSVPVCRFYIEGAATSSHFYGTRGSAGQPGDCELTLQYFRDWTLESDSVFRAYDPQRSGGSCPQGTYPVYRLYNNGEGGLPNHRFTNSPDVRGQMIAKGYSDEGARLCTTSPPPVAPPPPPPKDVIAGLWHGKAPSGFGFDVLLLDEHRFELLFRAPGNENTLSANIGTATPTDSGFVFSNGSPIPSYSASPLAGFGADVTGVVDGDELTLTSGGSSLHATYDPGFDRPASLASLVGDRVGATGHAGEAGAVSITIAPDGSFSAQGNCSVKGTITPRPDADVFDVFLKTTSGTCTLASALVSGVTGPMFRSVEMDGYVAAFKFNNEATSIRGDVFFLIVR